MLASGMAWEDNQPMIDPKSSVGNYANSPEDRGVVYWFPSLMVGNQEENLNELMS